MTPCQRKITGHLKKQLRKMSPKSSFRGHYVKKPAVSMLDSGLVPEAMDGLNSLKWKYLLKWKKTLKTYPKAVKQACLNLATYAKMHSVVYPGWRWLDVWIIQNFSSVEGVEAFEELPMVFAKYVDYSRCGNEASLEQLGDDYPLCSEFISYFLEEVRENATIKFSQLPSIQMFPWYDKPKESKMYLTRLPVHLFPEDLEKLRRTARKYFDLYAPKDIRIPHPTMTEKLGSSFYSDNHIKRRDCEEPQFPESLAWDHQHYWTSPTSKRDVWLPPKAYKSNSYWWHLMVAQITKSDKHLLIDESLQYLLSEIPKNIKPSIKVDIKGFGLQFPREVLLTVADEVRKAYPCLESDLMFEELERLFDNLLIKLADGSYEKPVRGTGLGYYESLKSLCTRLILMTEDVKPRYMFGDDMLIPIDQYDSALNALQSYEMVINFDKSGRRYEEVFYFAGSVFVSNGNVLYYPGYSQIEGVALGETHAIRKQNFAVLHNHAKWIARYHYVKLFGWEYSRTEIWEHPEKWGTNPHAQREVGYVRGGLLRKFTVERMTARVKDSQYYEQKTPYIEFPARKFDALRKRAAKLHKVVWNTIPDEFLHPEFIPQDIHTVKSNNQIGKVAEWFDVQSIISKHGSHGKYTKGLSESDALYALRRYSLCADPIGTYKSGGAIISSPISRLPGYTKLQIDIMAGLSTGHHIKDLTVQKYVRDMDSPSVYFPAQNLEQLKEALFGTKTEDYREGDIAMEAVTSALKDLDLVLYENEIESDTPQVEEGPLKFAVVDDIGDDDCYFSD